MKKLIFYKYFPQICFQNTHYAVSPISSSSNAFYFMKSEHPLPEIWSIYRHECKLQIGHFSDHSRPVLGF